MHAIASTAWAAAAMAAAHASAEVTFYEGEGFYGRTCTTRSQMIDFSRNGFNDRASSVIVLNDRVSPVRAMSRNALVDDDRCAPVAVPVHDDLRRGNERLFDADVSSVRAVMGQAEQRCWVEREQDTDDRGNARIPGAIVGAIIGGVLGHPVGGGLGNSIATTGGAVAGAAVGANVGSHPSRAQTHTADGKHRTRAPAKAHPDCWDVTCNFRGTAHRVHRVAGPGRTASVNRQGEPRA